MAAAVIAVVVALCAVSLKRWRAPTACLAAFFIGFRWSWLIVCLALFYVRMFFVTAGYHRYFSHRSFKTSRVFQFILVAA